MKRLVLFILVLLLTVTFGCKKNNENKIDIEQRKTDFITEYSYYEDETKVPEKWKDWFDYSYFKSQIDKSHPPAQPDLLPGVFQPQFITGMCSVLHNILQK